MLRNLLRRACRFIVAESGLPLDQLGDMGRRLSALEAIHHKEGEALREQELSKKLNGQPGQEDAWARFFRHDAERKELLLAYQAPQDACLKDLLKNDVVSVRLTTEAPSFSPQAKHYFAGSRLPGYDEGREAARAELGEALGVKFPTSKQTLPWEEALAAVRKIREQRDAAEREKLQLERALLLHPCGKCSCAGEGQCAWCQITAAKERAEEAEERTAAIEGAAAAALGMLKQNCAESAAKVLADALSAADPDPRQGRSGAGSDLDEQDENPLANDPVLVAQRELAAASEE